MKALVKILSLAVVPVAFAAIASSAHATVVPCLAYAAGNAQYILKVAKDMDTVGSELEDLIYADARALSVAEDGELKGITIDGHVVKILFRSSNGRKRSIGVHMTQLCESVGVAYVKNAKLIVK